MIYQLKRINRRRFYTISLATILYFLLLGGFLYVIAPSFAFTLQNDSNERSTLSRELVAVKGGIDSSLPERSENALPVQDVVESAVEVSETAVIPNIEPTGEVETVLLLPQESSEIVEQASESETAVLQFENEAEAGRPIPTDFSTFLNSTSSTEQSTPYGQLIIPSIGVNHIITNVPVVNGNWDISQLESQVGHLQTTGEHPGDNLAMTFIGHVTVPWPGTGPFADLILLKHGEQIIYRWNGFDYIYEVSRIFKVQPEDVHVLYHDDPNSLQLATCSGWNLLSRDYGERLVTRATLVEVVPIVHK